MKGKNLRTEPKHIVYLSHLLLLFKFCHVCKADNPIVETSEIGTEAVVKTTCSNPACKKEKMWYSQPLMPGTQTPAGNFLLCLGILLTGGSATRVFQTFAHMGLGCVSLNTFFKHQRVSVYRLWVAEAKLEFTEMLELHTYTQWKDRHFQFAVIVYFFL